MNQSIVVPIGHPPVVKDLAARKLKYAFPRRKVRDHMVSLFFAHLETLVVYRLIKGEVEATWGACPITQDEAIDELRKDAIQWGVPHMRNTLYLLGEDAQGLRVDVLEGELTDGLGMRTDDLLPYLDAGENCLAAVYDQPTQDLRLYRIHDGRLTWWHMQRPIGPGQAMQQSDVERKRAGLDRDALHYHIVEAPSNAA